MAATVPSSAILAACLVLASLGSISASSTCKPSCQWGGLYLPHPQNCSKFYVCNDIPEAVEFSCQPGLKYDMVQQRCEWPSNVHCIAGPHRKCDEILEISNDTPTTDNVPTTSPANLPTTSPANVNEPTTGSSSKRPSNATTISSTESVVADTETTSPANVAETTPGSPSSRSTPDLETSPESLIEEDCTPPCSFEGVYLAHPQDCTKFYVCDGTRTAVEFSCQPGLVYDFRNKRCQWSFMYECIAGPHRQCDELLN